MRCRTLTSLCFLLWVAFVAGGNADKSAYLYNLEIDGCELTPLFVGSEAPEEDGYSCILDEHVDELLVLEQHNKKVSDPDGVMGSHGRYCKTGEDEWNLHCPIRKDKKSDTLTITAYGKGDATVEYFISITNPEKDSESDGDGDGVVPEVNQGNDDSGEENDDVLLKECPEPSPCSSPPEIHESLQLDMLEFQIESGKVGEYIDVELEPMFDNQVTSYELTLPEKTKDINVHRALPVDHKKSKILVPGYPADDGLGGIDKWLAIFHDNDSIDQISISILVINKDGGFQPYTVLVNRAPCTDCSEQSTVADSSSEEQVSMHGGVDGGSDVEDVTDGTDGTDETDGTGEGNDVGGDSDGFIIPYGPQWIPMDWLPCDSNGKQMRPVYCMMGGTNLNEEECDPEEKPDDIQDCESNPVMDFSGSVGPPELDPNNLGGSYDDDNGDPSTSSSDLDSDDNGLFNNFDGQEMSGSGGVSPDDDDYIWMFAENFGQCIEGMHFKEPICFYNGEPCYDCPCDEDTKPLAISEFCDPVGMENQGALSADVEVLAGNAVKISPTPPRGNYFYWVLAVLAMATTVGTCAFLKCYTKCDFPNQIINFLRNRPMNTQHSSERRNLTSRDGDDGDAAESEAQRFVGEILTKLGFPEYSISTFTSKLAEQWISTIDQLKSLDDSEWKGLEYPETIEEEIRKELERPSTDSADHHGLKPPSKKKGGGGRKKKSIIAKSAKLKKAKTVEAYAAGDDDDTNAGWDVDLEKGDSESSSSSEADSFDKF